MNNRKGLFVLFYDEETPTQPALPLIGIQQGGKRQVRLTRTDQISKKDKLFK